MKRLLIAILFVVPSAMAQAGGATTTPPLPDQFATNQAPNSGNFENDSLAGYTNVNASVVLDNTQNHTAAGTWSAKSTIVWSSGSAIVMLAVPAVMHNHESVAVCAWTKTDASFASSDGLAWNVTSFDNTHGSGSSLFTEERQYTQIGASSNWEHLCAEVPVNKFEHGADGINSLRMVTKQTAGTMWVDDITVEEDWFPVRNFVAAPNYRGYVWLDKAPVERNIRTPILWNTASSTADICHSPVAGMVCGVAEIDPPAAQSLSTVTLTETITSDSACSTVLATKTFAAPNAIQTWSFVPSDYGGLPTAGTVDYLCAKLTVTSGGALIDSYPAWKLVFEGATFRTGLTSWYDVDNTWMLGTTRSYLLGTYDRISSSRCSGCLYTSTGSYENGISGFGFSILPQAASSLGGMAGAKAQGNLFADYRSSHFTSIMGGITTDSGINPTPGSDQLTPELAAYADYGLSKWQILNNWLGFLVNEDAVAAGPSTPTVSATTGSISANFAFVEISAGASPILQSSVRLYGTTLPSTATTTNLSTSGCAAVNCGLTITMPSCPTTRWLGFRVYVATNTTSSVPANSAFHPVETPSVLTGQLSEGDFVPCGASFTLTTLDSNSLNPPATDTSNNGGVRPTWTTSNQTDPTLWGLVATVYCSASPSAAAGIYIYDEPAFYALGTGYETYSTLRSDCIKVPISGVLIDPTLGWMFRDITDAIGKDPYLFNAVSPEEYLSGENVATPTTCNAYSTQNQIVSANQCWFTRAQLYVDAVGRDTYGYRPTWNVIRQFGTATWKGLSYDLIRRQLWDAVTSDQNWGNEGTGLLSWGWVSVSGMENTWNNGDTNAWLDSQKAFAEVSSLSSVLLTPILDTTELNGGAGGAVDGVTGEQVNGGTDISNVAITTTAGAATTVAAQCNLNGKGTFYSNAVNFPFGPVLFVAHNQTSAGLTDEYIFTVNHCDSSFNVTFGLPSVPKAANVMVLNEGRVIPISTVSCPNSTPACFTDTWTSLDVHQYEIPQPRGMVVH